ncbi:MAG: hypothetical protein L0Y74_04055 [candidate division Zixibacteria bacterium]|nr:hypothetical protein [candidate division Zixibacteria bacterium]
MSRLENGWAQIFILGYQGSSPSSDFLNLIAKYPVGGIIFFDRNIPTPADLQKEISNLTANFRYPPFLMIDQEGGRVNRIKKEFPIFPAAKTLGDAGDFQSAENSYSTTAAELKKLGINVNLAPVADVASESGSYMADRSFGFDPEKVSRFVSLAVNSIQSQNLLACAKHFPGIGSLQEDPHKVLPLSNQSAEVFREKDFLPFRAAIESNVSMIMTTHVNCPALDDEEPVTFSTKVVTDILRGELNFPGLIVSDDMEMGGIANYFEPAAACEKAFLAGHDLILLCHSLEKQKDVLAHFESKIKSDNRFESRVKESLARIESAKKRLKDV